MTASSTLTPANRFALIIGGLRAAVAARIGYYAVTAPMIVYICNRLNRINQRFQALAALILAGKLPAKRMYQPRAVQEPNVVTPPADPEAAARREFFPVWRLVPTYRFGWLCMVAPNWAGPHYAAAWGAAMRELLADPEMAALLAATPRMGELLRPLCWGLGIEASVLKPTPAAGSVVGETATASLVPDDGGSRSRGGTATAGTMSSDPPENATVARDHRQSALLAAT
jgi:hypothetical protein